MAWIGAVAGAAASMYGANQQNKASKNAGKVDIYREVKQMPGSEPYRNAGLNRAYELFTGKQPPLSSLSDPDDPRFPKGPLSQGGPPPGPGGPGSGDRPDTGEAGYPDQYTPIASPAKAGKGKGKGGGGKGGKNKGLDAPGFKGQSPETKAAVDNAMRVAGEMEKSPVVTTAQDYSAGTLAGEDQNDYRKETAGMLRNMDTSDYDRYLNMLWESDTGLGGGGGGGGKADRKVNAGTVARSYGGGGGGGGGGYYAPPGGGPWPGGASGGGPPGGQWASGATESDKAIKRILAGEDTPGAQAMRERIRRQATEDFNEQIRQRRLAAGSSGMFGGSGHLTDEAYAEGRFGAGLADAYALQDYDTYRQALTLGAGYDTAGLDRVSREQIAAADRAQSAANASNAAGAAQAALASQERMQRAGLLGNAIGMGLETGRFQASGMGSLAEGFSADQRNALNLAGDTNALGQAGWLNAGGLSLGSDQARNQWQSSQNALRASLAGTGIQRQALEFDKYRYNREAPMRDVAQYLGIISGATDPYAITHEYGYDNRSQSPSYSNPALQGLAGAAAGYQLGKDMGG